MCYGIFAGSEGVGYDVAMCTANDRRTEMQRVVGTLLLSLLCTKDFIPVNLLKLISCLSQLLCILSMKIVYVGFWGV